MLRWLRSMALTGGVAIGAMLGLGATEAKAQGFGPYPGGGVYGPGVRAGGVGPGYGGAYGGDYRILPYPYPIRAPHCGPRPHHPPYPRPYPPYGVPGGYTTTTYSSRTTTYYGGPPLPPW